MTPINQFSLPVHNSPERMTERFLCSTQFSIECNRNVMTWSIGSHHRNVHANYTLIAKHSYEYQRRQVSVTPTCNTQVQRKILVLSPTLCWAVWVFSVLALRTVDSSCSSPGKKQYNSCSLHKEHNLSPYCTVLLLNAVHNQALTLEHLKYNHESPSVWWHLAMKRYA